MNFNIYNSIILGGIIQGLIFTIVVLFSKKYHTTAVVYLTALICCFSLNNLQYYLQDSGIISSFQLFAYIWIPYQLITGVLLYYYGQKIMNPEKRLTFKNKLLLLPFVIGILISSLYKIGMITDSWNNSSLTVFNYLPGITEFFSIIYSQLLVFFLIRSVIRLENKNKALGFSSVRPELRWFKTILICFFTASFMWLGVTVLSYTYDVPYIWYIVWIFISIMIYWLGHIGIYKFGVQEERKKIRNYAMEHASVRVYEKPKNEHVAAFENLMVNNKRFLDSGVTLDKISEELELSKSHLSRIVNTELKCSFSDYINTLRVEEAKMYLHQPQFFNYTLVAIGLEAGFSSKTTFNNSFKKVTGVTPSEYKNLQNQ